MIFTQKLYFSNRKVSRLRMVKIGGKTETAAKISITKIIKVYRETNIIQTFKLEPKIEISEKEYHFMPMNDSFKILCPDILRVLIGGC